MSTRDFQRQAVYDAEVIVRRLFDNARTGQNPVVTLGGVTLTLPPEALFGDLQSAETHANRVLALPQVQERFGAARAVRVRRRKGLHFAHYEPRRAVIAIPDEHHWALRELVLLHELAHHLDPSRKDVSHRIHGPVFVDTYFTLLELVMAPEAALAARIIFRDNDIVHSTPRNSEAS
ncbi:Uncharacterised protein [Mycobacteroides abscessus]|uniref:TIGR04338 family metallohydrolase n=1 Tax=Mycobacteroides abscessus TaxID=36809 RepID=UPI0005DAB75E|nr:TIGR04338 family metallohydrolase [Mycobacteroides abscessus]MBN7332889.1 TIGR04338 family metallohydrolase [Mycobacteroides abscessus subsp. abscessus]MDM2402199.1 TIGR04338 family metallohydrolase [Mycobacteroides abscessus]MDM2412381.1 TIGR04338 family metallohydrolase [Mycobacteroides abscessus]CPU57852.1 Uncharacterised protein [Mycobacteroides abscessus]CPU61555.1 Uncharacterised protein [Mycobacteroides abscessus]